VKSIPEHITKNGPPETAWFGGGVDRSKMSLRVMSKTRTMSVNQSEISRLLGCESDKPNFKFWSLHAPIKEEADLDAQVDWILARVTNDLSVWRKIGEDYDVDLFCGLFLERPNRGASLSSRTMSELGVRGIRMDFDIYAPETEPNQALEPTPTAVTDRADARSAPAVGVAHL
jgi:hypothetical protein